MNQGDTLGRADELLQAWDERLGRIDASLLDLDARSRALNPTIPFGGATAERAEQGRRARAELFRARESVGEVIGRAHERRAKLSGLFNRGTRVQELRALLKGDSVTLAGDEGGLTQRGLLGPAQTTTRLTLDEALRRMEDSFKLVADAVDEIERAEEQGARELAALEQKLDLVTAATAAIGVADPEELALRRDLAALREEHARDPVGVSAHVLLTLQPRLQALARRRSSLGKEALRVNDELASTRRHLAELRSLHAQNVAIVDEARATLADGIVSAADQGRLDDLERWFTTVESVADAGRWAAAAVGLAKLDVAIEPLFNAEQSALTANHEALSAIEELSGRLGARRSQLAQYRLRGVAGELSLESEARTIETLLERRPFPLLAARAALENFERRLRALTP